MAAAESKGKGSYVQAMVTIHIDLDTISFADIVFEAVAESYEQVMKDLVTGQRRARHTMPKMKTKISANVTSTGTSY